MDGFPRRLLLLGRLGVLNRVDKNHASEERPFCSWLREAGLDGTAGVIHFSGITISVISASLLLLLLRVLVVLAFCLVVLFSGRDGVPPELDFNPFLI